MTEIELKNLEELKQVMRNYGGNYDYGMVEKAFTLCVTAHTGQKRISGEDYYYHPYNVAKIIVSLGMDTESVVASLLHDVVEDTDITIEEISEQFGKEVALLVDGVTKIGRLNFSTKEQTSSFVFRSAENEKKDVKTNNNKQINNLFIKFLLVRFFSCITN